MNTKNDYRFSMIIDGCLLSVGGLTKEEVDDMLKNIEAPPADGNIVIDYLRYSGLGKFNRADLSYYSYIRVPIRTPTEHEKQGSKLIEIAEKLVGNESRGDDWKE